MVKFLARGQTRLAYEKIEGKGPGILFLHGFRSDKQGTKALALDTWCRAKGHAYVRFDYQGHGESSGDFTEGTLSAWIDDAIHVLDQLTTGPQIVVGSSMGGWIMLHLALRHPNRIAALIGLAAAPDFTRDILTHPDFAQARATLERDAVMYCPCDHGDPYPLTKTLLEDGEKNVLLADGKKIPIPCSVRLIQSMQDRDVPWEKALQLAQALESTNVKVTLLKDGDHRLSRDSDIRLLLSSLEEVLGLDFA